MSDTPKTDSMLRECILLNKSQKDELRAVYALCERLERNNRRLNAALGAYVFEDVVMTGKTAEAMRHNYRMNVALEAIKQAENI